MLGNFILISNSLRKKASQITRTAACPTYRTASVRRGRAILPEVSVKINSSPKAHTGKQEDETQSSDFTAAS